MEREFKDLISKQFYFNPEQIDQFDQEVASNNIVLVQVKIGNIGFTSTYEPFHVLIINNLNGKPHYQTIIDKNLFQCEKFDLKSYCFFSPLQRAEFMEFLKYIESITNARVGMDFCFDAHRIHIYGNLDEPYEDPISLKYEEAMKKLGIRK